MPIIGFNFDKIEVEKKKQVTEKIEIKNNLGIKDIDLEKIPLNNIEEVLKFMFEFSLVYDPDIGNITINGTILYSDESKKLKDIQKEWKKNKKIDTKLLEMLLNNVLYRCHVKALTLAQEVNLPAHLNLPSLKAAPADKAYIG
ncbi:MAG: hypothetical protein AABW41_03270 [Nanoarchaeota archaeon]